MISIVGLVGLIMAVYWCRVFIQKHLQGVAKLFGLTGRGGLMIYTVIFFPGVVLHEMSHFLMAAVLGVRTGEINLFPRFNQNENNHQETVLGSVQVAKSDFFRGSLIGAAPFITGAVALYFLINKFFIEIQLFEDSIQLSWKGSSNQPLLTLMALYLIFVIANTMFSSKEDTHAWPMIVIITAILVGIGYISGALNGVVAFFLPFVQAVAQTLTGAMAFALMVDFAFMGLLFITEKGLEKVLKKRVRYSL